MSENQAGKTVEGLDDVNCSHLVLSACWCGGKAKGRGRKLECSNRKCGSIVAKKTRNESIARWNEIMKNVQVLAPAGEKTPNH